MRKILVVIFSSVFFISCSFKTNEEKALELIEPDIKANLIKPDSYEFAQIQMDSCFSDDVERNPEAIVFGLKVAKLYREYKEYASDAEMAESSMSIYAPSYGLQSAYSKQQQKKYKAEMEKAQRKATNAKEQIIQLFKDNKQLLTNAELGRHEFIAWIVSFNYRAEAAGGLKTMSGVLYYLNKDLTKITHRFSVDELDDLQVEDLDDLKYEFEDELKGLFEE